MTRIVAGRAGGRGLQVPKRGTRPTSERVREALFSSLDSASEVAGARVLDLYAGSGALGLEALSRGAADVWFVESDAGALAVLRANVAAVGLGGTVLPGAVDSVLGGPPASTVDLVLADPPYTVSNDALAATFALLTPWLADGALIVVERPRRAGDLVWPPTYRPLRSRSYGDTVLLRAEYARS